MNLRSLFNKLVPPKKVAIAAMEPLQRKRPNKYFLEFTNMEDSPVYELKETFVVGSEVGDVIISEPSLSPKHATFQVKNGLVSVIDNGSSEGTKLKEALLPKGRAVILEVDDELSLGAITIKLNGVVDESIEEEIEKVEEVPAPKPKVKLVEKVEEKVELDTDADLPEEPVIRPTKVTQPSNAAKTGFLARLKSKFGRKKKSSSSKSRKAVGGGVHRSANTLPRVFGMALDVVWTLIIWQVFSPFEEFIFALEVIPDLLSSEVLPHIKGLALEMGVEAELTQGMTALAEVLADLESEIRLSYLVSLWVTVRLVSTLFLGVSIGSFMSGIRSQDSALWKRAGGFLREVIGFVTAPWVIFDLPALFSRKTLKEALTFTTIYTPSKASVIVSLILYVPLSLGALVLSPFMTGLELPEDVNFVEKSAPKRKREAKPAVAVPVQDTVLSSSWFGAAFKIDAAQWTIVPRFQLKQEKKSKTLQPTLIFFNQAGISVPLVLEKTFDWTKLIGPIFAHNILAHDTYPNTWKYIESGMIAKSSALSYRPTDIERAQFSAELQTLIATTFSLTPNTLIDHIQTHGPFLKGYLDTKNSLMALVEGNSTGTWTLTNFGKTSFLVYDVPSNKPVQYLIPLVMGKGRLYRVNYSSTVEKAKLSTVLATELWGKANWQSPEVSEVYTLIKVIDTVADLARPVPSESIRSQLEQAYGALFEASAVAVKLPVEHVKRTVLVRLLENTANVLEQIIKSQPQGKGSFPSEDALKLQQKTLELKGQLESGNLAFFGIVEATPAPGKPGKKKK